MYGFLIGISTIISLLFIENLIKKHKLKISINDFWNIILMVILAAIIGARLYHVLDQWDHYALNPYQILNLKAGGFGIFGAIIFSIGAIYLYSKAKKISFLLITDLLLFYTPLVQIAGRLGNLFNNELYSKNGFPTSLLEAILNILVFSVFSRLYQINKLDLGKGKITALFLIFYGIIRIFIEPFRNPQFSFILNGLNITYLMSSGFIIIGLVLLLKLKFINIK